MNFTAAQVGAVSEAANIQTSFQAALDAIDAAGGGKVTISAGGIIYHNATLLVGDNTVVEQFGATRLVLAPGANCNQIRNKNWGSAIQSVTSITSADGITATATVTHGQTVGTSKWMFIYGATPEAYNGTKYVTFATSSTFTYRVARVAPSETLTTPATGTIKCALGNGNIALVGGTWDYDGTNQTTPDTWQKHGIYLRRVANLRLANLSVRNATKYAIHIANFDGLVVDNIEFDTASDGLHLGGSGKFSRTSNLRGRTGDDMFAITQGDYPQYHDSGYVIGAFDGLEHNNNYLDGAFTAVKLCPAGGNYWGETSINNLRGRFSGGGAMVQVSFDSGVVQQDGSTACTIGTINSLKMASLDNRQLSSKPLISVTCVINSLHLPDLTAALGSTSGLSNVITVGSGGIVNGLHGRGWTISGASTSAAAIVVNGGGTLGQVDVDGFSADTVRGMVVFNASSFSNGPINLSNGKMNACAGGIQTSVRATGSVPIPVNCSAVTYTSGTSAFLVGNASPGQISAKFVNCSISASLVQTGTWLNVTAEHSPDLVQAVTYAATITPDYAAGAIKTVTFTGAMTIAAPTNIFSSNGQGGRTLKFVLVRNSGGAAAITWNAAYVFPAGAFMDSISNTTRTTLVFAFDDNGKWVCTSGVNTWQ